MESEHQSQMNPQPTPHKAETPGLTLVACANQPWTYQRTEGPLEKYGRYSVKCSTGQTQFYVNSQIEARSIVVLAYAYSQLTQLTEERDRANRKASEQGRVACDMFDELKRMQVQRTASESRVNALEQELAEELESSCRQGCLTSKVDSDYMGQIAGSMVTDSGAISTYADQLRRLSQLGRFRIVSEYGRMVVGYWPENDPARLTPAPSQPNASSDTSHDTQ